MSEISPYLYGYAMRAATRFRNGTQASITFRHHGAVVRAASSDDSAARCDQVEALTDDGPCVLAMDDLRTVLIPRLDAEERWPRWREQAESEGFASAVAVPAHIAPGLDLALNLYSGAVDAWDTTALADADAYARAIGHAISLRVHLSTHDGPRTRVDLEAGAVVDRAVEAVMRCNDCTAEEALAVLTSASSHRNVTLDDVAATVLLALTGVDAHLPGAPGEVREASEAREASGR